MFTTKHKKAYVSVINDLSTDARVRRSCNLLNEMGFDVECIGRKLPNSKPLDGFEYKTHRMNLVFVTGPLFYFFFNFRLFFYLLFKRKPELLLANDLDTLLPNYLISRIKKVPLIYDSHELFCEVPELANSKFKKNIWQNLEKWIVPKLRYNITVNKSIATILEKSYNVPFSVVRNIPDYKLSLSKKSRQDLGISNDRPMLIYQGAGINIDRGVEEMIDAMKYLPEMDFYIIGSGDIWDKLKMQIIESGITNVKMLDKMPKEQLVHYTLNADLGLTLDKDSNLNYKNSLPNKIFDYIHAGIPVLSSKLHELEAIIKRYDIGDLIENHRSEHIAHKVRGALDKDAQNKWRKNLEKAKKELTWDEEKKVFINLVQSIQ
ncbi:MAG: glycosyltransferase [Bacteroidia bacterium]